MASKRGKSRVTAARVTGDSDGKKSRSYVDARDSDSDDDCRQSFNLADKLASKKFPEFRQHFVKDMKGEEVDLAYFQRSGFNVPIYVKEKSGLDIVVPDSNFTVSDVRHNVGARRIVDVMDCATQRNSFMTMKDFEDYYIGHDRKKQLNVISLEFSCTKLESLVEAPKVVRQIDWINNVWPRHLKDLQSQGTNDIREMKYPKVQKYCLMSVKGCYTDFHIDFGGSSVWYHILRGKKIFWIIPPTEVNLKTYESWTLSGHQGDIFFGDLVEKCGMVTLETGSTFFIPSGWIHAVYTPEDTLIFGGNFLHSFAIEKQIRVAQIEEATKVPQKFRFPFFTELQWYALDKYVYALLGKSHLDLDDDDVEDLLGTPDERRNFVDGCKNKFLTPMEIFGIKAIVMYIHALPVSKKNVPSLIAEPINLVRDIRIIVSEHKNDDHNLAVTGVPLLYWPGAQDEWVTPLLTSPRRKRTKPDALKLKIKLEKQARVPCKICQSCIRPDCGQCVNCNDMIRYGGPGILRKCCEFRNCIQPLLPNFICCNICGLDGWYAETNVRLVDRPPGTCALMECALCYEVTHPTCATDYGVEGFIKMDLPNSWECPKCIKAKQTKTEAEEGPSPAKIVKTEPTTTSSDTVPERIAIASGADTNFKGYQLFSVKAKSNTPKENLRVQLAEQILSASSHEHKKPQFVFRPPPVRPNIDEIVQGRIYKTLFAALDGSVPNGDKKLKTDPEFDLKNESLVMIEVFKRLGPADLTNCAVVCKAWNRIVQDPALWQTVNLRQWKITSHVLSLIVQRQPINLILDWSTINSLQLSWLLPRLPQTRFISFVGLDFNNCVSALASCNSPMLQNLDLSYVAGLNDVGLYKILSAPKDTRPGLLDKKSRLKMLTKLNVTGTELSDVSLRYVAQYLPQLTSLNLSRCWKVTDAGLSLLTTETLETLNLSGCSFVTNQGLQGLLRLPNLHEVRCHETSINGEGMKRFVEGSQQKLKVLPRDGVISRKLTPKSH